MQFFAETPHGYRWFTDDEIREYNETPADRRIGWMSDEYVGLVVLRNAPSRLVRQWDCMIEFGMDHDHDPVECERIMADMNPDYGVSEHYNNGAKEYY